MRENPSVQVDTQSFLKAYTSHCEPLTVRYYTAFVSPCRQCTTTLFRSNSAFPITVKLYETAIMVTPALCFMIVGASLSEPHISVTALRSCVCVLP